MSRIRKFNPNRRGRDFVVGDLHGCRSTFDRMLLEIDFNPAVDRMFCTGDLGDRGPDSRGCLALLEQTWFFSVMGNHEMMIVMAATEPTFNWDWWIKNGGLWAKGCINAELAEYAATVANLPLAIAVGEGEERFNVIHAEFFGSDADLDQALATDVVDDGILLNLLWTRDLIDGKKDAACQAGLSTTFCGHSITSQIGRVGQQIYIDTGAFKGVARADHSTYALTIIEPRTARVWRSQENG